MCKGDQNALIKDNVCAIQWHSGFSSDGKPITAVDTVHVSDGFTIYSVSVSKNIGSCYLNPGHLLACRRNPASISSQHPCSPHDNLERMDQDLFNQDLFEELFSSSDSEDKSDSGNQSEDTGKRWNWDPHAGIKPLRRHGHALEDEVDLEDDLPYGAATKVNNTMVDLIWELSDEDPHNDNWLPPKICRPAKGMISSTSEPRS